MFMNMRIAGYKYLKMIKYTCANVNIYNFIHIQMHTYKQMTGYSNAGPTCFKINQRVEICQILPHPPKNTGRLIVSYSP